MFSYSERCFAAIGDVARTRYLNSLNSTVDGNDSEALKSYVVKAKLAVLEKQFKVAESIYLEQGKVEDAMEMYQEVVSIDFRCTNGINPLRLLK
jgi:intraflagellar transport protein 172